MLHAGARCLAEWRTDKLLCDGQGGASSALSAAAASLQRQVALWVTSCIVNDPPKGARTPGAPQSDVPSLSTHAAPGGPPSTSSYWLATGIS